MWPINVFMGGYLLGMWSIVILYWILSKIKVTERKL